MRARLHHWHESVDTQLRTIRTISTTQERPDPLETMERLETREPDSNWFALNAKRRDSHIARWVPDEFHVFVSGGRKVRLPAVRWGRYCVDNARRALRDLSAALGLKHPDSSANLVKRARPILTRPRVIERNSIRLKKN